MPLQSSASGRVGPLLHHDENIMTKPRHAAAFSVFLNAWREHMLKEYASRITKWLDLLWQKGRADSTSVVNANIAN